MELLEVVELGERAYVGIPVTTPYQKITGIAEARQQFMNVRDRIQAVLDPQTYTCVHYGNDVLFTYIYCMEVSALSVIPDGMIGFTLPGGRYVKARTKDENPYALINNYLKETGLTQHSGAPALEVFRFVEEESKYHADVYIPVRVS